MQYNIACGLFDVLCSCLFLKQLFVEHGGCFKDECSVSEVLPGDIVTVVTTSGSFRTKKLILTTGAWTNPLLQPLRLKLPLKVIAVNDFFY